MGAPMAFSAWAGPTPNRDEAFAHLYFDGMGWGGCWNHDGNNVQVGKTSNCANTPVEVLETRYRWSARSTA